MEHSVYVAFMEMEDKKIMEGYRLTFGKIIAPGLPYINYGWQILIQIKKWSLWTPIIDQHYKVLTSAVTVDKIISVKGFNCKNYKKHEPLSENKKTLIAVVVDVPNVRREEMSYITRTMAN